MMRALASRRVWLVLMVVMLTAGAATVDATGPSRSTSPIKGPSPGRTPVPAPTQIPPPSQIPAPSRVPAPGPTPWPTPGTGGVTPGVFDWRAIGPPRLRPDRYLADLVAWRGGFAIFEQPRGAGRGKRPAAVWRSEDGVHWERTAVPRALRSATTMVAFRGGLALVVDEEPSGSWRGYGFRFGIWRSGDALHWRRMGRVGYRVPTALDPRGCQANQPHMVSFDGKLILYVAVCWDPCCGMRPYRVGEGVVALAARTARERGVIAWQSRDGRHWRRAVLTGMAPDGSDDYGLTLRGSQGELLAIREGRQMALLRSTNGLEWTSFGTLPERLDIDGQLELAPVDDGVLLIGESFESTGYGNEMRIWRVGSDGTTVETYRRQPAFTEAVLVDGSAILVLGRAWGPGPQGLDGRQHEWAWIIGSHDQGRTWDDDLAWTGSEGSCLDDPLRRGRTIVAIGCLTELQAEGPVASSAPAVWVAELPRPSSEAEP